MIIRVFRARVRPGQAAAFEAKVRELSIPLVRAAGGLLAYYSGRPLPTATDEFVMVTIWRSLEALQAFAGLDWQQSVIPDDEIPLLLESWVHHYEAIDTGGAA